MNSWRERATDLGYAAGWAGIRAVPEPLARAGFNRAGDLAWRRGGRGVEALRLNLRRVLMASRGSDAGLEPLVQQAMRSYARYWRETFRLPGMDKPDLARRAGEYTTGAQYLDAALGRGNGVVVALPHSGNWDVGALWLVDHGVRFTTVAERLRPESLFDRFVAYRESLGMEVIPLTGGGEPPAGVLAQRLRAGGCVALLADRDMSRRGVPVNFFGQLATMPPGPALLAATTGASLLPVHLGFRYSRSDGNTRSNRAGDAGEGWSQWIGEPIDLGEGDLSQRIATGTQALATAFEQRIAENPRDWHMLAPLWRADRRATSRRATAS